MDKTFFVVAASCFLNARGLVVREAWPCSVTPDRKFPRAKCFEKRGSCWRGTNMHTTICMKAAFIVTSLLLLTSQGFLPKAVSAVPFKTLLCKIPVHIPKVKISQKVPTERSCPLKYCFFAWLSTSPKDKGKNWSKYDILSAKTGLPSPFGMLNEIKARTTGIFLTLLLIQN